MVSIQDIFVTSFRHPQLTKIGPMCTKNKNDTFFKFGNFI